MKSRRRRKGAAVASSTEQIIDKSADEETDEETDPDVQAFEKNRST
jgi:hypothetical protein